SIWPVGDVGLERARAFVFRGRGETGVLENHRGVREARGGVPRYLQGDCTGWSARPTCASRPPKLPQNLSSKCLPDRACQCGQTGSVRTSAEHKNGGPAWTRRLWRPVLYQLSYGPRNQVGMRKSECGVTPEPAPQNDARPSPVPHSAFALPHLKQGG